MYMKSTNWPAFSRVHGSHGQSFGLKIPCTIVLRATLIFVLISNGSHAADADLTEMIRNRFKIGIAFLNKNPTQNTFFIELTQNHRTSHKYCY